MENEVGTIIKTLNNIAKSNKLSLDNELLLGQTFSSIENRVTELQSKTGEFFFLKFNTFFKHIEWDLSDIKNNEHLNWGTNVHAIIKKIQEFMEEFMEEFKVLEKIGEVEKKIQIVNRKIKALP